MLDFKLLTCVTSAKNEVNIKPVQHDCKGLQLRNYIATLAGQLIPIDKTIIVKNDNSKMLQACKDYFSKNGIGATAIYSGDGTNPQSRKENKNYLSILDSGLFAEDLKWVFTTKLMQDGVSIKENCAIVSVDNTHWIDITQLAIRARHNSKTGLNMSLDYYLLYKEGKEYEEGIYIEKAYTTLKNSVLSTQKVINALAKNTEYKKGVRTKKIGTDILTKHVLYNNLTGQNEVNLITILLDIYMQDIKLSTLDLNLKRVKRNDQRFNIFPSIKIEHNGLICSHLQEIKDAEKATKQATADLFSKDNDLFCLGVSRMSRSAELKELTFDDYRINSLEVSLYCEKYKAELSSSFSVDIAKRFLFWRGLVDNQRMTEILELSRIEYRVLHDRHIQVQRAKEYTKHKKGLESKTGDLDATEVEFISAVKKEVRNYRKKLKRQGINFFDIRTLENIKTTELTKLVQNDVLGLDDRTYKMLSNKDVLQFFKTLYDVKVNRIGKAKNTVYTLTQR